MAIEVKQDGTWFIPVIDGKEGSILALTYDEALLCGLMLKYADKENYIYKRASLLRNRLREDLATIEKITSRYEGL